VENEWFGEMRNDGGDLWTINKGSFLISISISTSAAISLCVEQNCRNKHNPMLSLVNRIHESMRNPRQPRPFIIPSSGSLHPQNLVSIVVSVRNIDWEENPDKTPVLCFRHWAKEDSR
jgi:hypothetical protein